MNTFLIFKLHNPHTAKAHGVRSAVTNNNKT